MSARPTARGRGKHYRRWRALLETTLRRLYAGGWPGRLWGATRFGRSVETRRHQLAVLPGTSRPGLRIGFVSDLHLGPTTPETLLRSAFRQLEAAAPDVLIMGGDYVFLDASSSSMELLDELVSSSTAKVKMGVLGNHDLWADHAEIERVLTGAGVQVLVNQALRLPPPWEDVALAGMDDPWTGAPDPTRMMCSCGDAEIVVTAAHSSDALGLLPEPPVLLLSGHTHGGQIALPGGRPIVLPPGETCRRYPAGLYELAGGWLFVSRGVGNTEVALRFGAPPEVAIIDLVASGCAAGVANAAG